jgi:hypothetical protein
VPSVECMHGVASIPVVTIIAAVAGVPLVPDVLTVAGPRAPCMHLLTFLVLAFLL